MKIVYDSQIFSAQKYGGISRYFCEVASRISKHNDICVYITAPLYINSYLKMLPHNIVLGYRISGLGLFKLFSRVLSFLLSYGIMHFIRPDVIHETYFAPFYLGPSNSKRVITIHDMIHEKFKSNFSAKDKTSKYKASSVKRADHIICVSESTRRDVIEILGVPADKTSVIYHGFSLMNVVSNSEINSIPTDSPFLLYVGNRGGYKNFSGFLNAYQKSNILKDTCNLICFGGGDFSKNETSMMQKLDVDRGKIIQVEGDDTLLSACYKNAVAFIYPSLYEGFGIPPLEAMAHDCPVVCSNTSSIPEVVGDAGEYFDPACVDSMTSAIEKVVQSNNYREKLITKGRERIKLFSWEQCAKQTLEVYKKII